MTDMLLRPVRDDPDDAEAVRVITADAFGAAHAERHEPPLEWTPTAATRHRRLVRHLARTDPGGCWLAADADGRPVGAALATLREGTWGLSLLAVTPPAQGRGLGGALLARALEYGRGTLRGIVCGTGHPVAARAYRRAGFDLHPTMSLTGEVNHAGLGSPDGPTVEAGARQVPLMDSVDRRVRGGAHGADHTELLRHCRAVVTDDLAGSGYGYVGDDGRVELLAATSRRVARRLLTAALLSVAPGDTARITDLTAEQQWALDVGLAAGLAPRPDGYLCLRGMRPPEPYIPSRDFL